MLRRAAARLASRGCEFTHLEHSRWEAAVRPYDKIFGQLTRQAARHVVGAALQSAPALDGATPGRGLDCATGPGYVIQEALGRGVPGRSLVGMDFSAAMLRLARSSVANPDVAWLEADMQEQLPAAYRGQFSWCTCSFGVLHLARPEAFFSVALESLRPGGAFVFAVWANLSESPAFQIPYHAIEEHGNPEVGLPPGPPFFKYSDPAVATRALVDAGFDPGSVRAELVNMEWKLERPEDLWEVFLEGTARTGAILERQEPGARSQIKAAMHRAVVAAQTSRTRGPPPYVLPQPCVVVTALAPKE